MRLISIATIGLLAVSAMADNDRNYSGAELYTNETFNYGKFEARMKMAAGSGTVSSMFLYHNDSYLGGEEPWVEVDTEILGKNPNSFQSNIITGYGPAEGYENRKVTSEDHHEIKPAANETFHTYGFEWTPDYVAWTLDGVVVRKTLKGDEKNQVEDLKKKPQGLRFNLWSHTDAGWVGDWNDAILPIYQYINWVKVYKYDQGKGENGSDFTLLWADDFKDFSTDRWSKGDWTFDGNRVYISPENIFTKDGMVILALTKKGAEGFNETVPKDEEGDKMFGSTSAPQPAESSSSVAEQPAAESSSSETAVVNPAESSSSEVAAPSQEASSSSQATVDPTQSGSSNSQGQIDNSPIRKVAHPNDLYKIDLRNFNAKGAVINNNGAHHMKKFSK